MKKLFLLVAICTTPMVDLQAGRNKGKATRNTYCSKRFQKKIVQKNKTQNKRLHAQHIKDSAAHYSAMYTSAPVLSQAHIALIATLNSNRHYE